MIKEKIMPSTGNPASANLSTQDVCVTYYFFAHEAVEIPSNLSANLAITEIAVDDGCGDCFSMEESEITIAMVVGAIISRVDQLYSSMFAVFFKIVDTFFLKPPAILRW